MTRTWRTTRYPVEDDDTSVGPSPPVYAVSYCRPPCGICVGSVLRRQYRDFNWFARVEMNDGGRIINVDGPFNNRWSGWNTALARPARSHNSSPFSSRTKRDSLWRLSCLGMRPMQSYCTIIIGSIWFHQMSSQELFPCSSFFFLLVCVSRPYRVATSYSVRNTDTPLCRRKYRATLLFQTFLLPGSFTLWFFSLLFPSFCLCYFFSCVVICLILFSEFYANALVPHWSPTSSFL